MAYVRAGDGLLALYGPEGSNWQKPDDAWYHRDGTRGTDPSDDGGEWLATPIPTPPTDEEWAAVRMVAFLRDLENVKQLVQVIAIFQSIEGAHAQAEGDEEKTYSLYPYGDLWCDCGLAWSCRSPSSAEVLGGLRHRPKEIRKR